MTTFTLRPLFLASLIAAFLLGTSGGTASASIQAMNWDSPLDSQLDLYRMVHLKRKLAVARPEILTTHTNQPPAPPAPPDAPDSPMGIPDIRGIDLTPDLESDVPARPPFELPGIEIWNGGPVSGLRPDSEFTVFGGEMVLTPPGKRGFDLFGGTGVGELGLPAAAPSVVPGPGAAILLLGAGLAGSRRRRRA